VDLDGDGIPDIISGSWPGELYVFRGLGKGQFAAAEKIKDKDGKDIKLGSASTVFAFDWNGDGKLDLLVGDIGGKVHLILNEGTARKAAFGKPIALQADGKPIQVPHGDSHPVAADWDRNGKPGLIVGAGDGSVLWYRNIGMRTKPKLAAAQTLVPANPLASSDTARLKNKSGTRAKVCVVDWNGDGWPDLLVGDFSMTHGEKPKMTDADRATEKKTQEELTKLQRKLSEVYGRQTKLSKAPANEDTGARAKREAQLSAVKAEYNKIVKEMQPHWEVLRKFQQPYFYHGHVWLYLRKPAAKETIETRAER
jgi:hypothetical protein